MKRRYRQQQSLRKHGTFDNLPPAGPVRPRFNRWSGQYESGWFVDAIGHTTPRLTDGRKHVVTIRSSA